MGLNLHCYACDLLCVCAGFVIINRDVDEVDPRYEDHMGQAHFCLLPLVRAGVCA